MTERRPKLVAAATISELPDREAVVSAADSSTAVVINALGAVLVSLFDGNRTTEQVSELVAETLATDLVVVRKDVDTFVADLDRAGLLDS